MPESERLRWVSKNRASRNQLTGSQATKVIDVRSSSLSEVRLKSTGSMPLLFKPNPLRLSAMTWPVVLLQPTPSQRQQSVPDCQDGRVVMELQSNMKDCLSFSRASA
ncbi:hypothetical protein GQ55_3G462700 [Panicum hallii var. hallii]|uniref:Uncharacterized protein n=1 Tax=Panicum hallii var. hallii TaxID=1504633 RepID=A0A2T7EJ01_9POAL|nr:hypothetical protein GQ55_3G462700 [Panicum hallii var. hallii]